MRRVEAFIGRGDALAVRFLYLVGGSPIDLTVNSLVMTVRARLCGVQILSLEVDQTSPWFSDLGGGQYLFDLPGDQLAGLPDAAAVTFAIQTDRGAGQRGTLMAGPVRIDAPFGGWPVALTGADDRGETLSILSPAMAVSVSPSDTGGIVVSEGLWSTEGW